MSSTRTSARRSRPTSLLTSRVVASTHAGVPAVAGPSGWGSTTRASPVAVSTSRRSVSSGRGPGRLRASHRPSGEKPPAGCSQPPSPYRSRSSYVEIEEPGVESGSVPTVADEGERAALAGDAGDPVHGGGVGRERGEHVAVGGDRSVDAEEPQPGPLVAAVVALQHDLAVPGPVARPDDPLDERRERALSAVRPLRQLVDPGRVTAEEQVVPVGVEGRGRRRAEQVGEHGRHGVTRTRQRGVPGPGAAWRAAGPPAERT